MEKRNAVFPVKRERVGATEVLVIELIDYTIQDTGQKLHHRLPDNIKPLTEHGKILGWFLTAPQDMCLSGVGWLS